MEGGDPDRIVNMDWGVSGGIADEVASHQIIVVSETAWGVRRRLPRTHANPGDFVGLVGIGPVATVTIGLAREKRLCLVILKTDGSPVTILAKGLGRNGTEMSREILSVLRTLRPFGPVGDSVRVAGGASGAADRSVIICPVAL